MVCLVLLLVGTAYVIGRLSSTNAPQDSQGALQGPDHAHGDAETLAEADAPAKLYACPMMCTPPLATPGNCPVCGMALAPVEGGELTLDHNHDLVPVAGGDSVA